MPDRGADGQMPDVVVITGAAHDLASLHPASNFADGALVLELEGRPRRL